MLQFAVGAEPGLGCVRRSKLSRPSTPHRGVYYQTQPAAGNYEMHERISFMCQAALIVKAALCIGYLLIAGKFLNVVDVASATWVGCGKLLQNVS